MASPSRPASPARDDPERPEREGQEALLSIRICSLGRLEAVAREIEPSHLVSLVDPGMHVSRPVMVLPENHLVLYLHDLVRPTEGRCAPEPAHIESLLAFGEGLDGTSRLLVHCMYGISRSPAAAYVLMCQRAGPGGERRAFERLVEIRPGSWPNPLIIAIADRLMSRGGRMLEALDRDLIKWL